MHLRENFKQGKRAPLYVLPTGGGKTAVFSHIAEAAVAKGRRIFILVHRHELLTQASRSLEALGVHHGMISPKFNRTNHAVQIASVQTIVKRLDAIEPPDLIVIDEAHHAVSSTYLKIVAAFPGAHLLGVTATPCRTDGQGLEDVFDSMVLGPSISELIALGHLVKPVVYAPPVGISLQGVHKRGGDYDKKELGERIDKPTITGDAVEHYLRLARGVPAIAFCVSIVHAENVAQEFRNAGVRAVRVDGGMDDQHRREAVEGLGDGRFDVLTSVDLIGEGVDIPRVGAAILLRPTVSLALYLQQVGRVLRPYAGKTEALILDHVGNTMRHGFVDDPFDWSLEGAPEVRGTRTQDSSLVRIEQCEACYFVYESGPGSCPSCGHEQVSKARKIEIREGELEQLNRDKLLAAKRARQEVGRARTLQELIEIGRSRGYSNPRFWAEKVFKGRQRA